MILKTEPETEPESVEKQVEKEEPKPDPEPIWRGGSSYPVDEDHYDDL
jgi:hypothetical protein